MRQLLIILLSFITITAKSEIRLDNVRFEYSGVQLIVTYDIFTTDNSESEIIFEAHGENEIIDAYSLSGDIGMHIKNGTEKKIIWNTKADNINYSGLLFIKLIARPIARIPVAAHVSKSLLFPGFGDYRLDNNKLHFLNGVGAYGAVVGSVIFNKQAISDYNAYTGSMNRSQSNTYFENAQTNIATSYVLAGVATSIWIYSAYRTYKKAKKLQSAKRITESNSTFYSQKQKMEYVGYSGRRQVDIKGIYSPPDLSFENNIRQDADIVILDENNGQANLIRASEKFKLTAKIRNTGFGDAHGVRAVISEMNNLPGISFKNEWVIGTIRKGETKELEIPITTNHDLKNSSAKFELTIKEMNGFGIDPVSVNIKTQEFLAPSIQAVDYKFFSEKGGTPRRGDKISLTVNIQNTGIGTAKNVQVELRLPRSNVFPINETKYDFAQLTSGEHKAITLEFFTNKEYKDSVLAIDILLNESWGRYSMNKTVKVSLNQELGKRELTFLSNTAIQNTIKPALLSSDVDINIPNSLVKYPNKYAIVIGNEDYASRQNSVQIESNVAFAARDARIVKEYLTKTLGFEEQKVFLLIDATSSEIRKEINKIEEIFERLANGQENEVLFYYAGHGYPDDATKIPYLVPVDVSTSDIQNGIRLNEITERLGKLNAKRVTILLDACFTGDGRNGGLISARTARIKPKPVELIGNTLIFSASSGDQTAFPYKEEMHGYFTYFILKKLKETKGVLTYSELFDFVKKNVQLETTIKIKPQDPQLNVSSEIINSWEKWQFKESK
jgi:uncharacterized repeat protein (TIGR01451 family)